MDNVPKGKMSKDVIKAILVISALVVALLLLKYIFGALNLV